MTGIVPEGIKLSRQEWRVYALLQDWADKSAIQKAINDPDGTPRWTPPAVLLSKLKAKLTPFGITIERSSKPGKGESARWRVAKIESEAAAA